MTAKYLWRDETGLAHPSLVVLDITEDRFPPIEGLKDQPAMQIREIYSQDEYFNNGKINRRKLPRIKGYRFVWHYAPMTVAEYALYLGYEVINR